MPRNVRSARGDIVDFDALIIKQQLSQAPMNIEVERRKKFIDAKEGRARGARKVPEAAAPLIVEEPVAQVAPVTTTSEPEVKKK